MKKEKEIFHNFMSSISISQDKKSEKYQNSKNIKYMSNTPNTEIDGNSKTKETEIREDDAEYGKNEEEKMSHSRNRFIRHTRESLSALCKLNVTYDSMPVQLASEIISVSTDLMEMYIRSVIENKSHKNQNKNEIKYENDSEIYNGNKNTGHAVKSIPPATMAAASLHWLALMKIPFTAFTTTHKNTVLRYLETVLTYSTETGKSGISFPFLIGVLTNLETVGVRWEDYDSGVKEKYVAFSKHIVKNAESGELNTNNEYNDDNNDNKKKNEEGEGEDVGEERTTESEMAEKKELNYEHKDGNEENGREKEKEKRREKDFDHSGNSNLLKLNILRYENLLKKTNAPKITELMNMSNDQYRREEIRKTELKKEPNKIEIENTKLLYRLSLKVAELPDSDLLRVIFLLGHRKIELKQMRIPHITTDMLDKTHTQTHKAGVEEKKEEKKEFDKVGSTVEDADTERTGADRTNTETDCVTDVLTNEGGTAAGGGAAAGGVGVKRSLLDVLDMRLEAVLPDLSPGTV
jgi:hypothetical protein